MDYEKGYVFDLMEQGGPTDVTVRMIRTASGKTSANG